MNLIINVPIIIRMYLNKNSRVDGLSFNGEIHE